MEVTSLEEVGINSWLDLSSMMRKDTELHGAMVALYRKCGWLKKQRWAVQDGEMEVLSGKGLCTPSSVSSWVEVCQGHIKEGGERSC